MVWGLGQSRAGSGEVPGGTGSEKAPGRSWGVGLNGGRGGSMLNGERFTGLHGSRLSRICWVFGPPTSPTFCCGGYYLSLFTTVHFAPKLVTSVFQVEDCLLD